MHQSITFITISASLIISASSASFNFKNVLHSKRQSTTSSMDSTYSFLPTATRCSTNVANLILPLNQTSLIAPSTAPVFITVGRGIQNYTCTSAGTWKSVGAIAQLFDISCLDPSTFLSTIQSAHDTPLSVYSDFTSIRSYLGEHTFVIASETNLIEPKFDFGLALNDEINGYVIGNKTGTIPSIDDSVDDVAWLELTALEGGLATTVFRVATIGGSPPPSCGTVSSINDDVLSVPYAAQYWFFK